MTPDPAPSAKGGNAGPKGKSRAEWRKPSSLANSPAAHLLGARVRARREELGLSLEAAAERTVLHWTYIGQVERGVVNPTVLSILRIADGLQMDAGDLLDGLHVPENIET